jgi:Yip1 domain
MCSYPSQFLIVTGQNMVDLSGIEHKSLIERAKAIILTPNAEWAKVDSEGDGPDAGLLKGYILPLILIGPLASLIGGQLFGIGAFGFSYKPSLMSGIGSAVFQFVMAIVTVYILTFVADFFAAKFGGQSNRNRALKLVAYGSTAAWLAGIFGLIPSLGFFGLLGLYSIYLIYTGAGPMMKVPQNQAGGYTAVTILCAVVLIFIASAVTSAVAGLFALGGAAAVAGSASSGGTLTLPGGGTIDTGKLEQMGKQAEAAANGKVAAIDVSKIQALLPAAIGSYQRTGSESTGVNGLGSQAGGTYTAGDKSFTLRIMDMSALGALAGMGAALNVQHSETTADGYEKAGTVNGQMQMESWSKSGSSGKFSVMVGNRFMIEADGSAASIDELKAAVATVDQGNLMSLAD